MIKAIKVSLCFWKHSEIGPPVCTAFIQHLLNGIESVIDEAFGENYLLAWQTVFHSANVSQLMAAIRKFDFIKMRERERERQRGREKEGER